jgi:hypothetical protein
MPIGERRNKVTGITPESILQVASGFMASKHGSISAFGTYTINPDDVSVALRIVGSSFPNWNGTVQRRLIEINGDQLKYTNPVASIGGVAPSLYIRAK